MTGERERANGRTGQPDFELRPATPADEPFLLRLFAVTREAELALFPFDAAQREAFVGQQFSAQRHFHALHLPGAIDQVVVARGADAGRLVTAQVDGSLRIVDVALLPEHRGRGLGGALLASVIAEADAAGLATSVHVEITNPARRLYARLGFRAVGEHDGGSHLYLERPLSPEI